MGKECAQRFLLTGFYLCAGLAACGSLVAHLLEWTQALECLAPVIDRFGDPVSVNGVLRYVCDLVTYGSGSVCALSLLMGISVNCCWNSWCFSMFHQTLTVLMCVVSVACGTALTMDFMMWCHSLQNTLPDFDGCEEAAEAYDNVHRTSNMTAYYRKMELQQVCQWAAVPFLLSAVIVYSIVMKSNSTRPQEEQHPRVGGRYYLLSEESAPLLVSESSLLTAGRTANEREAGRERTRSTGPTPVTFSANTADRNANVAGDQA